MFFLSHRFHRYTQIFLGMFLSHADFADDADFFHHRMTRNLFGDFLLRRLLTDFRRGDLFGRCRYPLRLDKAIHQRFHKKSVYICEICGTKNNPPKKNLCISVKSVGQNLPTKKNLRHLRNLRDQNNRSIYRARAIGQRPKFRENPMKILSHRFHRDTQIFICL